MKKKAQQEETVVKTTEEVTIKKPEEVAAKKPTIPSFRERMFKDAVYRSLRHMWMGEVHMNAMKKFEESGDEDFSKYISEHKDEVFDREALEKSIKEYIGRRPGPKNMSDRIMQMYDNFTEEDFKYALHV